MWVKVRIRPLHDIKPTVSAGAWVATRLGPELRLGSQSTLGLGWVTVKVRVRVTVKVRLSLRLRLTLTLS